METKLYSDLMKQLRFFFEQKSFIEVPSQSRTSILAACEDPSTVTTFNIGKKVWPLPQTGQMQLEVEILKDKGDNKFYCQTTSYRDEPNPIEGRHNLMFPLFEFESPGSVEDLIRMEKDLLKHLGFQGVSVAPIITYEEACSKFKVSEITIREEYLLKEYYGDIVFLTQFPERTSPFWNMKRNEVTKNYNKVDVILNGHETFGSAERECDKNVMAHRFNTVSDGEYAELLYSKFGKERVLQELKEYFAFTMKPRYGGGIGVSRLINAIINMGVKLPE